MPQGCARASRSSCAATSAARSAATCSSARIARAGDLAIASSSLRSSTGTRTLTLKPSKRLLAGAPKRFTTRLVIVARDGAGNQRTVTTKLRIRG